MVRDASGKSLKATALALPQIGSGDKSLPRNPLKTRTGYPMGVRGSHNHPKGVAGA